MFIEDFPESNNKKDKLPAKIGSSKLNTPFQPEQTIMTSLYSLIK